MVGEIRDTETAQIAIESALTGHLVLTTLHANDAPLAAARLIDMGIEPFLVTSSVECVVAQRLVRRLCECKTAGEAHEGRCSPRTASSGPRGITALRAGRVRALRADRLQGPHGLYEVMLMTDSLRRLILDGASHDDLIRAEARAQGMRTLHEDGLEKVVQGITSIAEVLRVLGSSASRPRRRRPAARRRARRPRARRPAAARARCRAPARSGGRPARRSSGSSGPWR